MNLSPALAASEEVVDRWLADDLHILDHPTSPTRIRPNLVTKKQRKIFESDNITTSSRYNSRYKLFGASVLNQKK
jgi:hypothetical protein